MAAEQPQLLVIYVALLALLLVDVCNFLCIQVMKGMYVIKARVYEKYTSMQGR